MHSERAVLQARPHPGFCGGSGQFPFKIRLLSGTETDSDALYAAIRDGRLLIYFGAAERPRATLTVGIALDVFELVRHLSPSLVDIV